MSDIRSMPYVTVEQVHRFREAALAENAAYIAAACPANILALLDSHADLLDIANECHKIIKELCACYSHHEPLATLERIEAITKAEAL